MILLLAALLSFGCFSAVYGKESDQNTPTVLGQPNSGNLVVNPSVRIKDIARFEGIRDNQLSGLGLVVGLDGTGDGRGAGV
ncbi:MAG: flagellar basal body P-ring protein FlgI, partial [Firmicutes bacterium]|nr:flagellar basal body P-ring protein FlgI [Bacillota bacterium]